MTDGMITHRRYLFALLCAEVISKYSNHIGCDVGLPNKNIPNSQTIFSFSPLPVYLKRREQIENKNNKCRREIAEIASILKLKNAEAKAGQLL